MWIYACPYHTDDTYDWDNLWSKRCGICSRCISEDLGWILEDEYRDTVQYYTDGYSLARTIDSSWVTEDRSYWTEDDWKEEHAKGRKRNSKKWKNEPRFDLMDLELHPCDWE